MQKLVLATCGLCSWLLLTGPIQAQDDECRAVVAKAMKAVGGEEKLAAYKAAQMKGKGTIFVNGMDLEFTAEIFSQQPDKQKVVVDFNINGMNFTLTQVHDGKKGWQNIMGTTTELGAQEMMEHKESMNAERVNGLAALKEKEYQLSSLGEVKVGEQQTTGILVTRKGYRDISLYFDKKSHLLVKLETRALDPNSKQEVNQEKHFSDYKELIPGLKLPGKMLINSDGKKFMDLTVLEARSVERHDDSIFAKP